MPTIDCTVNFVIQDENNKVIDYNADLDNRSMIIYLFENPTHKITVSVGMEKRSFLGNFKKRKDIVELKAGD